MLSRQVENTDIDGNRNPDLDYHCKPTILETLEIQYRPDILAKTLERNAQNNRPENDLYYYHGDHLGSADWVTNKSGEVIAEYKYAPYGELVFSEKEGDYNERYKFTGKERDSETGYDYFGARFFWSALGHWLSVDPLADKYPGISPYAYCSWDPINKIDPDGRWSVSVYGHSNRAKYPYALYKVQDNNGNVIFQTVVKARGTTRNRKKEGGDTPYGRYKQNKWRNDPKFGRNDFIDQTYESGEGKGIGTDDRDRMHTHGGGDYLDKDGNVIGLKGTRGCFRMADEDLVMMKDITDALESLIPSEHMTSLTFIQDESVRISDNNFVSAREEALISNGTVLQPEVTVTATPKIE